MALLTLISFFQSYRAKRLAEDLSQRALLSKEIKLIGAALLVIVGFFGGLIALALYYR